MKKLIIIFFSAILLSCISTNVQAQKTYGDLSISELTQRANEEDAIAQFVLGEYYYEGSKGLTNDKQKAAYWWKKSAEHGYAVAQYKLGICYMLEEDDNAALYWLRKAQNNNQSTFSDLEKAAIEGAIKIIDQRHYLYVNDKTSLTSYFSYEGGREEYEIKTSGKTYTVRQIPSWCHVTTNPGRFTVSCGKNKSVRSKDDWFRVTTDDNKEVIVYVNQGANKVEYGGFTIGYVQKQWVTTGGGRTYKENAVWNKEDGYLHGFQMGVHFQPCFKWGLGLYTGLFYECYISTQNTDNLDNSENIYADFFQEHSLYVPLHLYYRIPFAYKYELSIHGGLGFDCGIYAEYSFTKYNNISPITSYYGEACSPKRINLSTEISLGFRVKSVMFNAFYSRGITDHEFYSALGNYKTIQNKLGIGLSFAF
jgi:hypothetical protein